jgi:hypothetical protein
MRLGQVALNSVPAVLSDKKGRDFLLMDTMYCLECNPEPQLCAGAAPEVGRDAAQDLRFVCI